MRVELVVPGDSAFKKVDAPFKERDKQAVDYNTIAVNYNTLPLRGILLAKVPGHTSLGNLARVLKGRGLQREHDYTIMRIKKDATGTRIPMHKRPVAIKRLTKVDMELKNR